MADYSNVPVPAPGITDPFLISLLPKAENRLPITYENAEGWLTPVDGNPLFNTQRVQCSYPISGGYGPTPRYLFYILALFAILKRKSAWVVTAALGSVMTYSATAAVHAVVLVVVRTKIIPDYVLNKWFTILVAGTTLSGVNDGLEPDALWLPILPMAWDSDGDAVLAIVGTAFLALLPMQLWSSTFKTSNAKTILFLWSGLLFIGTVSALINALYVDLWTFPQLRFCPHGMNDTFPFTNSRPSITDILLDQVDGYFWNRTVNGYFRSPQGQLNGACIYPCFSSTWPLRDPSEITVLSQNFGANADSNTGWWLLIAVYAVVCSSCISSLTVFAIDISSQSKNHFSTWIRKVYDKTLGSQNPTYISIRRAMTKPFLKAGILFVQRSHNASSGSPSRKWLVYLGNKMRRHRNLLSSIRRFYVSIVSFYARMISPMALLFFVIWSEWYIWNDDPGGESFKHVGQWGALVAAGVVGLAALVARLVTSPPTLTNAEVA
ncbi:hypothetical protein G7Y79_00043g079890 [Physcia stellaris]|nr:hypothetical protein G7Y79_00043g079890 [Physcia stellaris]